MAMTTARLRTMLETHRTQFFIGTACVAVFGLSVGAGVAARRRTRMASLELAQLSSIRSQVSSFRGSFEASPANDSLLSRTADTLAIATPRDVRVSLAEQIASRAEATGLANVRVRFTAADTSSPPTPPQLVRSSVALADYTITVDGTGSLASALSLVDRLPPTVALQRLTAIRSKNGAEYRLVLAVFESTGGDRHG
jgi:hypothetical protein